MIVGFDCGRSGIKVVYPNGQMYLPHILGKGRDRTLTPTKTIPLNNIDIVIEGERYFVGELAKESFAPISTFQKSHIHINTKIFLLSVLALLPDNDFAIIVGLPIADFRVQKKDLAKFLQGRYTVLLNGEAKSINIQFVSVFPQCVGGVWSHYLDSKGNLCKNLPPKVGCIDIGFRDFGFALLEHGEFVDRASWSFPFGLHNAFMAAIPELDGDYTINDISPDMINTKHYEALHNKIMQMINPYWPKLNFPILSCGGGSQWVKVGTPVDNPVYANANGFYKLGVMKYA